ncbi:MAG: hypothetical protein QNK04_31690 [Myxococcota bacterium]|nr:hypothetical protein [Myxococcota bacterium]
MTPRSRWTAACAVFTLTLAAAPADATPPVTSGLEAQFVADDVVPNGGFVEVWTESFSGVLTANQTTAARRPELVPGALNGHDVVRFDGVDDWLSLSSNLFSAASYPKTVFAVVRSSDFDGHVIGTGSFSTGFLPSFGSALVVVANNYFYKVNNSSAGIDLVAPEFNLDGSWQIVVATVASGAARIETLCSIAESNDATNAFNYSTSYLGAVAGRDPLEGDVAEILVYDRVLSPAEVDSVRDDLALGYGLTVPDRSDADADGIVDACDTGLRYLNAPEVTITSFSPIAIASLVDNAIDAASALSDDPHTTSTHVYTNDDITLVFDLGGSYDLEYFHFWNYFSEGFDADDVSVSFRDAKGTEVAVLDFSPETSQTPIFAQDIALEGANAVRTVELFASGTNGETDFQNVGFTGRPVLGVPVLGPLATGALALALAAVGGLRLARRRRTARPRGAARRSWPGAGAGGTWR